MRTLLLVIGTMLIALLTGAQITLVSWEKEKGARYIFESTHDLQERAVWTLEAERGLACHMFSLLNDEQKAKMYWDIEEWIEKKKKIWLVRAINLYDQEYILRIDFRRKTVMIHDYPSYTSKRMSMMKGDVDLSGLKERK